MVRNAKKLAWTIANFGRDHAYRARHQGRRKQQELEAKS